MLGFFNEFSFEKNNLLSYHQALIKDSMLKILEKCFPEVQSFLVHLTLFFTEHEPFADLALVFVESPVFHLMLSRTINYILALPASKSSLLWAYLALLEAVKHQYYNMLILLSNF